MMKHPFHNILVSVYTITASTLEYTLVRYKVYVHLVYIHSLGTYILQ